MSVWRFAPSFRLGLIPFGVINSGASWTLDGDKEDNDFLTGRRLLELVFLLESGQVSRYLLKGPGSTLNFCGLFSYIGFLVFGKIVLSLFYAFNRILCFSEREFLSAAPTNCNMQMEMTESSVS